MSTLTRPVDKRIGVARAKRRHLDATEQSDAVRRARAALARAGWRADATLDALSLTDVTQTYRVREAGRTAVLKLAPVSIAAAVSEAHAWMRPRGARVPDILWQDVDGGAMLFEDVGEAALDSSPSRDALGTVAVLLAELHAAGRLDRAAAARALPTLAAQGWPTPAAFAARLLTQVSAAPAARAWLMDAVATLGRWIDPHPRLIVGDLKREHIHVRDGDLWLTDLELVTAWDVIPSNLATLLAFPGQFDPAVDEPLRRWVVERYAEAHDRLEGTATDVDSLDRAVTCAAALMDASLSAAEDLDAGAACLVTRRAAPSRGRAMVRARGLTAATAGLLSVEHELGPGLFGQLLRRLDAPRSLRVLDLGCGDGLAVAELAQRWPHHRCIGLDRLPGRAGVGRVRGDAQALPLADGTIDVAWGVQLLQYVPDKLACLQQVHRVLAADGVAVFAMTEHFDRQSAFVPPLGHLARRWLDEGTVASLVERRIGDRRALTFSVHKRGTSLECLARLTGVVAHVDTTHDAQPYLQSHYDVPQSS